MSEFDKDFNRFWEAYPKKVAIMNAWEAWCATDSIRPPADALIAVIEREKAANGGKYLPSPEQWLRRGGWADSPSSPDQRTDKPKRYRDAMGNPTASPLEAVRCECGGTIVCDCGHWAKAVHTQPLHEGWDVKHRHWQRYCPVCNRNFSCDWVGCPKRMAS